MKKGFGEIEDLGLRETAVRYTGPGPHLVRARRLVDSFLLDPHQSRGQMLYFAILRNKRPLCARSGRLPRVPIFTARRSKTKGHAGITPHGPLRGCSLGPLEIPSRSAWCADESACLGCDGIKPRNSEAGSSSSLAWRRRSLIERFWRNSQRSSANMIGAGCRPRRLWRGCRALWSIHGELPTPASDLSAV